ncbi:hypothetical protein Tco_1149380 [Tanacetum coccineum]
MVNDTCTFSFKRDTDEATPVCSTPPRKDNNEKEKQEAKIIKEPSVKCRTHFSECLKNFKVIHKENLFHSKTPQVSSICAITSILPSIKPEDFLIMGDEHLSTFHVEEIVPISRESEDTSGSDSENVLLLCDDFFSINVPRDDFVTFSNPLFEFNDEYVFITPLSNSNKDECLAPEDDIEILLHHDPSTPMKSIASILKGFIDEPPFEENDDLFDLECNNDEIDVFLAIKVPMYIEEGYFDSKGDVIFLENLLSDDTTHNLSPEVFFDHEPQQNEPENDTLITFSPKSDPLHHEFAG